MDYLNVVTDLDKYYLQYLKERVKRSKIKHFDFLKMLLIHSIIYSLGLLI